MEWFFGLLVPLDATPFAENFAGCSITSYRSRKLFNDSNGAGADGAAVTALGAAFGPDENIRSLQSVALVIDTQMGTGLWKARRERIHGSWFLIIDSETCFGRVFGF